MLGSHTGKCAYCLCLLLSVHAVKAATAQHRLIAGQTDFTFKLQPANPTELDLLLFYDPTGSGTNACEAAKAFGAPIPPALDFFNNHLIVGRLAQPDPNVNCTADLNPVRGIEGSFGPLSAGNYVFRDYAGLDHPFTVGTVPEPAALAAIGAAVALLMQRRRSY